MSPKKIILRELSKVHQQSSQGGAYQRPSAISGFSAEPEKYQKAVNELLQARLVEGRKDSEGNMTIALNHARMREVQRELRPFWARPAIWAVIAIVIAVGAGLAI